jgi:two-component system CheB/CheR fusion protein
MTTPRALRILVVEDHPDTRAMLVMLLEMSAHEVVAVGSLQEAVVAWPTSGCDVVLSDLGLPDGDGWELLGRLPPPVPAFAVAMSGYGTQADRDRSAAAGFRHHLVKPMEVELLERVLAQAQAEIATRLAG